MTDDADIHKNKLASKTYVSRSIETTQGPLRVASKVFDSEGIHFVRIKDETVIRRTETGRVEIVAKFLEDDRSLSVVTLQSFNGNTGAPHKTHFSFIADEIPKLLNFFTNIAAVELNDSERINISDVELRKLILSKDQASSLVQENQDIFSEVLRSEITKEDVVALGYRKKQILAFHRLLSEREYFEKGKIAKQISSDEGLWQAFFEKNTWLFGYGLSYFFVTGFENKKLEQIVQNRDIINKGKRVDGFMKTRGIINSTCFVEIKTHETKLLENAPYRAGCWAPSKELSGAVAQIQGTVASALQNLSVVIRPKAEDGSPTGEEIFNFKPRAFIVIGSQKEFVTDTGINTEKLRSFEIYRNSLLGIEILTYDELYERAKFIVETAI